jgi:hypothetical protein
VLLRSSRCSQRFRGQGIDSIALPAKPNSLRYEPSVGDIAPPLANGRNHHHDNDQDRGDHEGEADRPRHEDQGIAPRDEHRPSQVFPHHRTQHKPEQHRRQASFELRPDETEDAEEPGHIDLQRAAVDAVNADGREDHDGGKEQAVWGP